VWINNNPVGGATLEGCWTDVVRIFLNHPLSET
jgi:hypothetical protein